MSEFLAEAQVLIRPNTALFRAELVAQLAALKVPPVSVPVIAAGTGMASTSAATSQLAASQAALRNTTAALALTIQELNVTLGASTVASNADSLAKQRQAGSQSVLDAATKRSALAQANFRKGIGSSLASLTGLRGAVLAASAPFLAGAIAATAFGKSLSLFASFETELNVFQATTESTAEQMERVSALAIQLGEDITLPAVSASDAATAMTELAKAGLSVEDTLDGVRGVLQLSTAANIGVGEAANFAANALNSFGLAGDQAGRVADVLANAANSAQGSISDFGLAFQQASAVARQVGFSLEETATTLTILAQNGLKGSDAGTSLRVALLRLVNPTKKAAEVIDDLGIQVRDAQGNIRPDVFVQFGEATRSFAPAMRDAALATVFGADAIRAVAIASREGRAGLLEVTTAINQQGTASDLATARTKGLAGQTEALKNNLSTLGLEAGKAAAVLAGPLLAAINALVDGVRNTLSPLTSLLNLLGRIGDGGADFDPSTASAVELLEEVQRVREEVLFFGNIADQALGDKLPNALKAAIGGLQQQRAEFKALGLDVSALDILIAQLQGEMEKLGDSQPGKKAAASLSPLQAAAKQTRELIKQAAADGIDTAPLKKSLREIEIAMLDAGEKARFAGAALAQGFKSGVESVAPPSINRMMGLEEEALDIEIGGGGTETIIANLEAQANQLRKLIVALDGAPKKRLEAKQKLAGVLGDIDSIRESEKNELAASARKAEADARAAETEANKIAAAAVKAAQAIADALTGERGRLENLISRAGGTDPLQDDIRFTQALVRLINAQIDEARKRIKDVSVRKAFIEASNRLLIQLLLDIKNDKQQMAKDARTALATRQANILEGIGLDIELADINDNTGKRIALRLKLIAALKRERRILRLTGNALKENRNEIARINEEIEEIKNETKETGKGFAALAFEFMQTQQGFTANLLGNLFPASATQGLVGGSQAQAPTEVFQATALAQTKTGPTFGQTATTTDILRQMLQVLREIQSGKSHPEATYQRTSGGAALDVM